MGDSGRLSRGLYPRVGRRSETVKGSTGGRLFGAVGDCSELVTVYPFLEKIRAFSYSPKREGPQVGLIVLCLRVYVRAIIGGSAVLQGGQILGQLYMRVVICPDPPPSELCQKGGPNRKKCEMWGGFSSPKSG